MAIFDAFVQDNPKNQIAQNARSGRSMASGGLTDQDKAYMMKYLQLKFVILYQQTNKFVGKYCFYGCWCFPQAAMFEWQGYGQPVDNIDQSCKEYTTCFNCVYNQKLLGQRCNEWDMTHYNVQGVQDPNTGKMSQQTTGLGIAKLIPKNFRYVFGYFRHFEKAALIYSASTRLDLAFDLDVSVIATSR